MNEQRKPQEIISAEFNIFFDEYGNLGQGGGLHLKVTALGNFDETIIQRAIVAGLTAVRAVGNTTKESEQMVAAPPQKSPQTPPEPRETPSSVAPDWETKRNDLKRVMAICHGLEDNESVEAYLAKEFSGASWTYDKNGHPVPDWDFLDMLSQQQIRAMTAKLRQMEREQKARQRA